MKNKILKSVFCALLTALIGVGCIVANPAPIFAAEESEEPLMRIAMFTDLHVEYGLQRNEKPMRESTAKAAKYARAMAYGEGVDVVLVGGDMSGGRGDWKEEYIAKTKQSIYDTMASATKDGKVLFVTGNHDPEPSVKAGNGSTTAEYSGDYEKFMTDACGDFVSALYADDISPSLSPYNELLCYRYTIDKMEFLGMNTPYMESQAKVCGLYYEQAEWLEDQLAAIGKDKTVFLLCHYPVNALNTVVSPSEYASSSSERVQSKVVKLLNTYSNVVYCYGHVHDGESYWPKNSTSETVVAKGNVSLAGQYTYRCTGYIYAHMGSMGYYDNVYQPGGLSIADPDVVQFVMVEIYANRITFQTYNTGKKVHPNGKEELAPLSIVRNMSAQFGLDPSYGVYPSGSATSVSTDEKNPPSVSTETNSAEKPKDGERSLVPVVVSVVIIAIVVVGAVILIFVLKKPKPVHSEDSPSEKTKESNGSEDGTNPTESEESERE